MVWNGEERRFTKQQEISEIRLQMAKLTTEIEYERENRSKLMEIINERLDDLQNMHDEIVEMRSGIQHMVEWTHGHTGNDDKRHADNLRKFDKIDKTIGIHQKVLYVGLGVFLCMQFLLRFVK